MRRNLAITLLKGLFWTASVYASDQAPIDNLEKNYWSPKSDQIGVVQERTYSKEKRFAVALAPGSVINDSNSTGTAVDFSMMYHFEEKWGIELNHSDYKMSDNETTRFFNDRFGVTPDHNKIKSSTSIGFNWSPIYAKMSLFQKKIVYFDMSVGSYFGVTQYNQQKAEGNQAFTTPHFGINVSQLFFFSKHFAIRFNFRNQWSRQERVRFEVPNSGSRELGAATFHDTTMFLGLVLFK